jgi:hypothetical protein
MLSDTKSKLEDLRLVHTVWNGTGGCLRRGKRIRDERFESVRGECDFEGIGVSSMLRSQVYVVL